LEDLSRAADPLKALLNFSRLCDAVGDRAGFFRQLREQPALRARLAQLMGWAQSLADTLIRETGLLELLEAPAASISRPELRRLARGSYGRSTPLETKLDALRRF